MPDSEEKAEARRTLHQKPIVLQGKGTAKVETVHAAITERQRGGKSPIVTQGAGTAKVETVHKIVSEQRHRDDTPKGNETV